MQLDLWNRRLGWLSFVGIFLVAGGVAQIRAAAADDAEQTVTVEAAKPVLEAEPAQTAAPASVPLESAPPAVNETHKKLKEAHDATVKEMRLKSEKLFKQSQVKSEQFAQEAKEQAKKHFEELEAGQQKAKKHFAEAQKDFEEQQARIKEHNAQIKKRIEETRTFQKRILGGGAESGRFWLGVECREAAPELRAQLGLEEGQGLVVSRIAPESPAAAAGLKQHDALVLAGETKLAHIPDLSKAANAGEGKPLELSIIRGGKPQKITVTPAERLDQIFSIVKPAPGMLMPTTFQNFRLPDNMSVSIARTGQEPAKVSVKRGEEHWEVTADDLSKLPDDVRPVIEQMLNGPPGILKFNSVNVVPGTPGTVQVNGNTLTVPAGITITPGGGNTFRIDAPNKAAPPGGFPVQTYSTAPFSPAAPVPAGSGTLTITTAAPAQPVKSSVTISSSASPKQSGQMSPELMKRLDQVTRELEKTQQDLKLLREALPAPKGEKE